MWGMTPHFTIRVWGRVDSYSDEVSRILGTPRKRMPVAEIEVDTTICDGELTITNHRGLDLIPQKMLTQLLALNEAYGNLREEKERILSDCCRVGRVCGEAQ